jgi:hypothetical protein
VEVATEQVLETIILEHRLLLAVVLFLKQHYFYQKVNIQLLLELVVVAHHNFLVIPHRQHLKKVETLLFLETIFQLPQLAAELVQEEVNQLILMVVLVVEVIALHAPQEQELLGKVLLADKGWGRPQRVSLLMWPAASMAEVMDLTGTPQQIIAARVAEAQPTFDLPEQHLQIAC